MAHRRAGGYIDRGDGRGWVLDDTPPPKPPPPPPVRGPVRREAYRAGGWTFIPEPEPGSDPETSDDSGDPKVERVVDEPAPTNAEVRAWARANGVDVSARGAVSAEVMEQYIRARQEW